MQPAKKPRKVAPAAAGRPRKLSREAIVEAAEALIIEHGTPVLSLRTLAARLGVKAPTLYTYFENLDEVKALALDRLLAVIPVPDLRRPQAPAEQIVEVFVALRNLHMRNPSTLDDKPGSAAWEWSIRCINQLTEAYYALGADRERAMLTHRLLRGIALTSALDGNADAAPNAAADEAERMRLLKALPDDQAVLAKQMLGNPPAFARRTEDGLRHLLRRTLDLLYPAPPAASGRRSQPRR